MAEWVHFEFALLGEFVVDKFEKIGDREDDHQDGEVKGEQGTSDENQRSIYYFHQYYNVENYFLLK